MSCICGTIELLVVEVDNRRFRRSGTGLDSNMPFQMRLFNRKVNSFLPSFIPSCLPFFPSALQLRASFGLHSNHMVRSSTACSILFICPTLVTPSFFRSRRSCCHLSYTQSGNVTCSSAVTSTISAADYLRCEVDSLTPNPQPGGTGYPSLSGSYPFTCPVWVALPVASYRRHSSRGLRSTQTAPPR
jgi:hypothetical protein